jgi:hypothetical protein
VTISRLPQVDRDAVYAAAVDVEHDGLVGAEAALGGVDRLGQLGGDDVRSDTRAASHAPATAPRSVGAVVSGLVNAK